MRELVLALPDQDVVHVPLLSAEFPLHFLSEPKPIPQTSKTEAGNRRNRRLLAGVEVGFRHACLVVLRPDAPEVAMKLETHLILDPQVAGPHSKSLPAGVGVVPSVPTADSGGLEPVNRVLDHVAVVGDSEAASVQPLTVAPSGHPHRVLELPDELQQGERARGGEGHRKTLYAPLESCFV